MPATRAHLHARLQDLGIDAETFEHRAVFTVEENRRLRGESPGGHCKSLFLKDKKGQLWLVVCLEDRRVDMKRLQSALGSARLSFGNPDLLFEVLGVEPGAVTPFGLINDTDRRVRIALDADMMECEILHYHPLVNTATTRIRPADLRRFIEACGHLPQTITFDAAP